MGQFEHPDRARSPPSRLPCRTARSRSAPAHDRAVETTNGPSARREGVMDQPRDHLLACTRRGPVISTRLRWARPCRSLRAAAIAIEVPTKSTSPPACLRSSRSRASAARSQARARPPAQVVGLEGLLDEVVGALLDGGDRGLDVAVAADDDHRDRRMLAPDHVEQLQAVERLPCSQMSSTTRLAGAARSLQRPHCCAARRAYSPRPSGCPRSASRMSASSSTTRISCPCLFKLSALIAVHCAAVAADVPTRFPSRPAGIPD